MSIRRDPIYVSVETWRWLRLLAKAETRSWKDPNTKPPNISTPDEVADQILRQAIREQHPELADHDKQIEKLEREVIQTLQKENNDNTNSDK